MLRAAIVCLSLVLATRTAGAMCRHRAWLGNADDQPLPPSGTVYFDLEPLGGDEQLVVEPADRVHVTQLSRTVTRIDYALRDGDALAFSMTSKYRDRLLATARIGPTRQEPSAAPRVLHVSHVEYRWTCSTQDSVRIELDQQVAAVRARWTYGGATTEWVLPPHGATVELGKLNCGGRAGSTLGPESLRRADIHPRRSSRWLRSGARCALSACVPTSNEAVVVGAARAGADPCCTHGACLDRSRTGKRAAADRSAGVISWRRCLGFG